MQFNKEDQSSILGAISIKTNSNFRFTMDSVKLVAIKPCKVNVKNLPLDLVKYIYAGNQETPSANTKSKDYIMF